mmetsp:Transcript_17297/g.46903  ORF Transcript_17297/g.46903 Transcript_17297/m.46903 type:complete len:216 (-) Transcript_17297:580-1227(-)
MDRHGFEFAFFQRPVSIRVHRHEGIVETPSVARVEVLRYDVQCHSLQLWHCTVVLKVVVEDSLLAAHALGRPVGFHDLLVHCVLRGDTLFGVKLQQVPDRILCIITHTLPVFAAQCVIAALNLVHDFSVRGTVERGLTAEHEAKTHTRGPHITRLVISSLQNLRRTIRHGASLRPDDFPSLEVARQTEVSNLQRGLFQRFILVEEQEVLKLDVPM